MSESDKTVRRNAKDGPVADENKIPSGVATNKVSESSKTTDDSLDDSCSL